MWSARTGVPVSAAQPSKAARVTATASGSTSAPHTRSATIVARSWPARSEQSGRGQHERSPTHGRIAHRWTAGRRQVQPVGGAVDQALGDGGRRVEGAGPAAVVAVQGGHIGGSELVGTGPVR